MGTEMKLLDLFCRAGGAAVGYHRAGFEVTGVDLEPMHGVYPFTFIQGDAIEYAREHGHEYDAVHASPRVRTASRSPRAIAPAPDGATGTSTWCPRYAPHWPRAAHDTRSRPSSSAARDATCAAM
jgi:hypothetical protein